MLKDSKPDEEHDIVEDIAGTESLLVLYCMQNLQTDLCIKLDLSYICI